MGKFFSNKRRNYIHQYNEVKEKMYPIFSIYASKRFEHQVQDMYASQKFQIFSTLRRLETHFQHHQGHKRAGALKSIIFKIIQTTNLTADGVEHQKTSDWKKWRTDSLYSRSRQSVVSSPLAGELHWRTLKLWEKSCIGLIRLVIVHRIRMLVVPFSSSNFRFKMFFVLFYSSPIRSYLSNFLSVFVSTKTGF